MSIVLYWHPMSSASPIASALAELDVAHERVLIDLKAGEQRRPEFLALNPNGAVPTLTVDGAPMFEALAIHLWLGERYGVERGLWPAADTPERLQAMSWCAWSYVTYGAAVWSLSTAPSSPRLGTTRRAAGQARAGAAGPAAGRAGWPFGQAGLDRGRLVFVGGSGGWLGAGLHRLSGRSIASHRHVQAWLDKVQARPAMRLEQG